MKPRLSLVASIFLGKGDGNRGLRRGLRRVIYSELERRRALKRLATLKQPAETARH